VTEPEAPGPPAPRLEFPSIEFVPYRGRDRYARLWARLRPNGSLWAGVTLIAIYIVVAIGSLIRFGSSRNTTPYDTGWQNPLTLPPGPSWSHPFGTDKGIGIDVLDGILRATPNDLALLGAILLAAAASGVLIGAYAGLRGGWVDLVAVGASDLLSGVPPFFFVLVLYLGAAPLVSQGSSLTLFAVLFAFVLWPYYARPVRAMAQRASVAPYAESARAAGASPSRLLFRHVLPNSLSPAFAQIPIDVYNIFFVLTVFPFLGCFPGGQNSIFHPISITPGPLYPEWGSQVGYGACYGWSVLPELDAWWSYVFPGAVIVVFGLALMLLCDGLQRHLASGPIG
jgi:peptide/nickel transport system permease protein